MDYEKYLMTESITKKFMDKHGITPEQVKKHKEMVDSFNRHQKAMRDNENKIHAHFKKFLASKNFTKETIAKFESEVKQIIMRSDLQVDTDTKMTMGVVWVDILRKIVKGEWR